MSDAVIAKVRAFLLALFYLGMGGIIVELFLLEHTEEWQQWIPFIVIILGFITATLVLLRPTRSTLIVFRAVLLLFIAAGGLGIYLHYSGNTEFELERVSSLRGLQLFWKSIRGATPVGAPGYMTQLGLLGLIYTYRHPGLERR